VTSTALSAYADGVGTARVAAASANASRAMRLCLIVGHPYRKQGVEALPSVVCPSVDVNSNFVNDKIAAGIMIFL